MPEGTSAPRDPSEAQKRNGYELINGDGFISKYSPTRKDKKRELQRLLLAHSDIHDAHKTSDHFLHIIKNEGIHAGTRYAGMDHPLYTPLVSAMAVSYAKPFVENDTVGTLKKEWSKFSNPKWDAMHRRILTARHEIFAHSDATVRQIKIVPPRDITLFNKTGKTHGIGFSIAAYGFTLLEVRTFAELSYDLARRLFTECERRIGELYDGMDLPQKDFSLRYHDGL